MARKASKQAAGGLRATIVTLLLAVLGVSALPRVAFAGSNGQQVYFNLERCGGGLDQYVGIRGYNQNGQYVTWSGWVTLAHDVKTTGWWWVGNITVYYHQSGAWHTVNAYVPKTNDTRYQYWPDVVRVDCHGSWHYTTERAKTGSGFSSICVSSSNLWGSYTQYTYYSGYQGIGWDAKVSTSGYAIAGNTSLSIFYVTGSYKSIVCG
jgi:hypothetical protein